MMDGKMAKQTLERLHHGDPTSDEELMNFIEFTRPAVTSLASLGERYHLAWNSLCQDMERCQDYLNQRKIMGVTYLQIGKKVKPFKVAKVQTP